MKDIICIYHANCPDGFTSAWVVWKALKSKHNIEFIPGFYGETPPDVTGKTVFIVDFSYKRSVMEELVKKADRLVHIDHHDSAIKDMKGFAASNFESFYSPDNTQSGAMLTWNYFFSDEDVPELVKYVDDNDRWAFKLPNPREIRANLASYEYTFENWDKLESQSLKDQLSDGLAISRRFRKDINELLTTNVRRMNIGGYNIPVANVPKQFGSDICSILAKDEPFSAYYFDGPILREFGLRSINGVGIDVSEIAKMYGGGGHKHASGFRVSYEKAKEFEV